MKETSLQKRNGRQICINRSLLSEKVNIADGIKEKVITLGMFTPTGYIPVDVTRREGNKAIVKDIEPEVIFQPLYVRERKQCFAGYPFRVVKNEAQYFIPDTLHRERAKLLRKYPLICCPHRENIAGPP